jgi:hypothetical protein
MVYCSSFVAVVFASINSCSSFSFLYVLKTFSFLYCLRRRRLYCLTLRGSLDLTLLAAGGVAVVGMCLPKNE